MDKNDFKPFATGKGANVTSQPDWEALPALLSGFTAGKASSAQVNKALRQASFIAAALAQYTASKSGQDVLDDGDLSGFIAKMSAAFGKDFQTLDATLTALAVLDTGADKLPYFTGNDTAGQTDLTSVGRDIIGKDSIADILTYLGLGETINLAKNAVPATRRVNSKPLTGDITLSAGDVGALPIAGGRLNGPLGIGTDNALGGNSIVFGDNDTGIKWISDGVLGIYANNAQVGYIDNSGLHMSVDVLTNGILRAGNGKTLTLSSANNSALNAGFNLWGDGGNRPTVIELGDDQGWHLYSQRNTDGSIQFVVNGQVIPGNYGNFDARYLTSGNVYTKGESDNRYVQNIQRGAPVWP
ncbi:phage tail protein, partial [Salmonella enterica subsp. enterica serovar Javiana]|nr:phage tail protein [Salmonella enterica subsp. enterica serovar Kentucky]ECA5228913.1 phage tail protein [Salmonella enterica subsp. enterica serovar Javiana]EDQ6547269.1 phage tail protein [Salmonella enterica subsp. enterica]EBX3077328.1 phage tail protein [Salmonella enterica subsp. enterica serovar Kentucky]EDC4227244.1 phage tail protein [Salmonella enterica subsp. enterica serovar Javiana]